VRYLSQGQHARANYLQKNDYNTEDIRLGIVSCRAITTFKVGSDHLVAADRNHETFDSKYLQLTLEFELIVL
jgi:hypothetical protein